MSEEIEVKVNSYGEGRPLSLVYTDPVSGRRKAVSAKTRDWREAERLAGELEKELRSGRYAPPSKVLFDDFLKRYTDEKLSTLSPGSTPHYLASLRLVKRVLGVDRLAKLTPSVMSQFQSKALADGMKPSTLGHHLRHIKAALRWAEKVGLMSKAPAIEMPKRGGKGQSLARSRAVNGEEHEKMLLAAVKVRPQDFAQWQRFITGVWLCGLRVSEAVALTWHEGPFCVDVSGKFPVFVIESSGQKSGKAEIVPTTPDFGAWLLAVPEDERTGRVFPLLSLGTQQPIGAHEVSRIVADIGRRSGVKVGTTTKRDKGTGRPVEVPIYAGCHSLRRGFGSKWARRVSSSVLKRLMRHSSIATTEAYYVHLNASDVAAELWQQWGAEVGNGPASNNTFDNTTPGKARFPGVS